MKEAEQMGLKRREVGGERGHKEKLETRRPTDRPTRFCFSPCFRTAHFVTSEEEEVKWCGAARRVPCQLSAQKEEEEEEVANVTLSPFSLLYTYVCCCEEERGLAQIIAVTGSFL